MKFLNMTKFEKANEIRKFLKDMIADARREHRELDEEEQKVFDEQKNELIALAEEIKGAEDKLDKLADEIPDVEEKSDEEEQKPADAEAPADESESEVNPDEVTPAEEKPAEEGDEKPETEEKSEESEEQKPEAEEQPAADAEETVPDDKNPEQINKENPDEDSEKKEKKSLHINMENNFSLMRAIRAAAENRPFDEFTSAVIEEGRKQLRASGKTSNAQIVLPTEKRTITVADNHDSIIEKEFTDILDILTASPVMQKCRSLSNLVGDVQIPQILAGTAGEGNVGASWLGENAENTLSHFKFDHRALTPKRLSTTILLSKSFLMQDSIGVEQAVRKALADSVRQKLETTLLSDAAGTTTKPVGIFYQKDQTEVKNFKQLCAFEAVAERANYNKPMEYLLSPEAKAEIRSWTYGGGRTQRMIMEGQEIDGTPYISTSNMEANSFAYINWDDILVGTWQGLELEVANDLALQRTNQIALTLSGFFDWIVLRPEAIQYATIDEDAPIDPSTGN